MKRRVRKAGWTALAFAGACALAFQAAPGPARDSEDGAWPPDTGKGPCTVGKTTDAGARMRDGTVLRADVYRPRTKEKVPVILMRTQYGKEAAEVQPSSYQSPEWFASHCYLVVVQDVRGQYASDGDFYEFANEGKDGYDSVEWAARLPGSNGKVGMYGSSYVGATQWLAAQERPPHLKTIVPDKTSDDYYDGWTYEGGAFRLNFVIPWAMRKIVPSAAANRGDWDTYHQVNRDYQDVRKWLGTAPYNRFEPFHPGDPKVAPYFFDWIKHRTYDDYWRRWAPKENYGKVGIPVLNYAGWYDAFLDGSVRNYQGMAERGGSASARANQRLVIGPWDHTGWGRPTSTPAPLLKQIGPVGNSPVNEMMLAWWDHHLKGKDNGVRKNGVDYFVMGADKWRTAPTWPLPQTRWTDYYLSSTGHATGNTQDGTLSTTPPAENTPTDHYTYDPRNPVPSVGGHSCCTAAISTQGPYDQQQIEQRPDIAVYTGAPLAKDTEVTGPITVTLHARSSAPDTDWTAKLIDVHPDGTAVNLNSGIVRASYRESMGEPKPIVPGTVYEYKIKVWPTSNLFKKGHRIRLDISSSDYPQYDPNPNTGSWLGESAERRTARQTVLHDAAHPSKVTLPVIPDGGRDQGSGTPPQK
ncbi:CocE/NonD family hydrolase [Streptomyces sp. NRRL F-5755]|uniref:CocE/NonD family hydrolase n=1 Tax=Streptomyces sp. NRRL F-5755 TaxID=1519475 RepID=UPI0018FE972B|nr:CocE/NonD family hydrolase [Streptomyces sp. NRRL F-5755]